MHISPVDLAKGSTSQVTIKEVPLEGSNLEIPDDEESTVLVED